MTVYLPPWTGGADSGRNSFSVPSPDLNRPTGTGGLTANLRLL